MNFNIIASVFVLFAAAVSAAYSNHTFVPTTVTLSPTHSVNTETSTLTYEDETTTFFITSTYYTTHWYTPATTSSVEVIVTDIPTTYESSGDSYTSTYTSTITSTLEVTETVTSSATAEHDNRGQSCVPVTHYVTVGTVTVTPEPVTHYVTVTAGASSHQWSNSTQHA